MALDGIFLSAINLELQNWLHSRVDRVFQISKFEIVLVLRKPGEVVNLLISANASSARINFTRKNVIKIKTVPHFCVILRKHLVGARFRKTKQLGFDRTIFLHFEKKNEIGDLVQYVLVVEIMGKHSNIILIDQNSFRIIDAIKKSNEELKSVREIKPKAIYEVFNYQNKLNVLNCDLNKLIAFVFMHGSLKLSSAILNSIEGISPVVARELAFGLNDKILDDFDENEKQEVVELLKVFKNRVETQQFDFIVLSEGEVPKEFCWFELKQFGNLWQVRHFSSASELLDFFYDEKLKIERINQCCYNVVKKIKSEIEKVKNKKEIRQKELSLAENCDDYKKYADLLSANMYKIKKGDEKVEVVNFYNNSEKLIIKIKADKTPIQNIQHFYNLYKKSRNARCLLNDLILDCDDEIKFLESELDVVMRASSEYEIFSVISDLQKMGVYKNKSSKIYKNKVSKKFSKIKNLNKITFLKYESTDGYEILCGRNNAQNDYLTLKKAKKTDLWLHVKNYSGSHVIVISKQGEVSKQAIEQAAVVAVQNSSVCGSNNVAVDYTLIKNVKKPNGGRPGMVIFKNNKTIYVNSDEKLVHSLIKN